MAKTEKKVARIQIESTFEGKGEERHAVPHFVEVRNEKELREGLTIPVQYEEKDEKGILQMVERPFRPLQDGKVRSYVTRDGAVLRFDAESGALIGERRSSA